MNKLIGVMGLCACASLANPSALAEDAFLDEASVVAASGPSVSQPAPGRPDAVTTATGVVGADRLAIGASRQDVADLVMRASGASPLAFESAIDGRRGTDLDPASVVATGGGGGRVQGPAATGGPGASPGDAQRGSEHNSAAAPLPGAGSRPSNASSAIADVAGRVAMATPVPTPSTTTPDVPMPTPTPSPVAADLPQSGAGVLLADRAAQVAVRSSIATIDEGAATIVSDRFEDRDSFAFRMPDVSPSVVRIAAAPVPEVDAGSSPVAVQSPFTIGGVEAPIVASDSLDGFADSLAVGLPEALPTGMRFVAAAAVPVPEPQAWTLLALGIVALGLAGRRRARPAGFD